MKKVRHLIQILIHSLSSQWAAATTEKQIVGKTILFWEHKI